MPATRTDLTIEQGTDWSHGWSVTVNSVAIDGTWIARGQIRRVPESAVVLHEFTASIVSGAVVIAVTPAESSAWTWRTAQYDVEIVNADESLTLRVAEGTVTVDPEVTR